ncbi:MAG TPA: endonuclease/exonuclease/phosphatase family protein [Devosia sp.]|nr:endonuclease/exonuclease/phosphatase family protein [Devosia sp.]
MRIVLGLVRLVAGIAILVAAVPAALALLGFAVPAFDLFNHLQFLLFFGTLASFILALLVFGRLRAMTWVAALGFLCSAWIFVPEWVAGRVPRAAETDRPTITLMTHNLFGLNYDMERVARVVAAENPDIIALQEYFPEQAGDLDLLLKPDYPYWVRCQGGKRANLGLYSRIPFDKEMASGDCPTAPNGQRTAHIIAGFTLADGSHFSVMTTHMDWPYPIERQRAEFAEATATAKSIEGPLVLVGDFNSTPWSYALRGFAAETNLTRETHGELSYPEIVTVPYRISKDGFAATIPFLPLDQVFQRGLIVHDLHRGPATGSDHLPIIVRFSVAPAQVPGPS